MTILRRHVKNFAFKHPAKSGMMSLCITQDKGENNTIWKKRAGNYKHRMWKKN